MLFALLAYCRTVSLLFSERRSVLCVVGLESNGLKGGIEWVDVWCRNPPGNAIRRSYNHHVHRSKNIRAKLSSLKHGYCCRYGLSQDPNAAVVVIMPLQAHI